MYADTASLAGTNQLRIDDNSAVAIEANGYDAEPDTTDVTVGSDAYVNASGSLFIQYVFRNVTGMFHSGEYIGTAADDSCYINCGFTPRMIVIKEIDNTGRWYIFYGARDPNNKDGNSHSISMDLENTVETGIVVHILSNGFVVRETASDVNAASREYLFFAISEAAFGGSMLPCVTAR